MTVVYLMGTTGQWCSVPVTDDTSLADLQEVAATDLACGFGATLMLRGAALAPGTSLNSIVRDQDVMMVVRKREAKKRHDPRPVGAGSEEDDESIPDKDAVASVTAKFAKERPADEMDRELFAFALQLLEPHRTRFSVVVNTLRERWEERAKRRHEAAAAAAAAAADDMVEEDGDDGTGAKVEGGANGSVDQGGNDDDPADLDSVQLPEDAMAMLGAMGFPATRAKKALLLNNNDVEAASSWLLDNADSPNVDRPLTKGELRQLMAPETEDSRAMQSMQRLMDMGFSEIDAVAALHAADQNESLACSLLLGDGTMDILAGHTRHARFFKSHPLLQAVLGDENMQEHLTDTGVLKAFEDLLAGAAQQKAEKYSTDEKVAAAIAHFLTILRSWRAKSLTDADGASSGGGGEL